MRAGLFITFIVLALSCKKENGAINVVPVSDTIPCNTYPINPKNFWVYSTNIYTPSGSPLESKNDTIRLSTTKTYNGKLYYSLSPLWIRNKDCNTIGVYDPEVAREFDLKNNVSVNDSVAGEVLFKASPCKHGIKLYLNKDRTIINNVSCYKIQYYVTTCKGNLFSNTIMYLREGLGIVKAEEYRYNDGGSQYLMARQELIASHIE